MTTNAGERLAALAALLSPDLAREIDRLQHVEREHELLAAEVLRTNRQINTQSVMVGELRQRAVRAEHRLEELGAEAIVKARASAHLHGSGFVRVTALGRGRYDVTHLPTDQVIIRTERGTP